MKHITRIIVIILILSLFSFVTATATPPDDDTNGVSNGSENGDNGDSNGNNGNNGNDDNGDSSGNNGNNGGSNGNGDPGPGNGGGNQTSNQQHQREVAYLMDRIRELERQLDNQVNDPVNPVPRRPLIQVTTPLWVEMEAGTRRTLYFTIRNMGADGATSVVTTADFSDARGITGVFMDAHHSIASLNARAERTFSFQITVNESVQEGFYGITFNHEFLNARNERIRSESHVTIRVTTDRGGSVYLRDFASTPSRVTPGDDFYITAMIRNDSTTAITEVAMSISDGMTSDGIFLRDSTSVVRIPTIAAGQSERVSIGFTSAQRARSGAYPLGWVLSFTDARGERQSQQETFFVSLAAGADQNEAADVVVTNISRPSGAMRVGQEFEMTLTLQNNGAHVARNIRVDAVADAERAIVPRSTSRMLVSRLDPGAESQLTFRFAPTELGTTRSYDIGFTVTYETGIENTDGSRDTVTFTQFQGVNVFNPDDNDDDDNDPVRISTPRIIVSDYRSDPLIVQAGQEFDLELSFLNTSSNRVVRNIRVTLTVEDEVTAGTERRGSVFIPVGRSSTFFIDNINPRDEVTEHIRFFTLPDASPRNYIINVNFEYEDQDNNPFEARESIGINVKQVTRLDTSEIHIPTSASTWQPMFFSFELYNTGRVTLSNLMIRVEGNFQINQSSTFFGSLNPGAMDFFENTITPMEPGMQELAIIITFEDDTGELIEQRREFMVDVFEMDFGGGMEMRPPFGDEDYVWDPELGMFVPASQGLNLWLIGSIAAIVLISAGIVTFVAIRIKKKSKEMVDFDE
ncbi:MAG: hypothetical protein FWC66_04025 [Oscillospiraceae bacterium]|nr:hypothetical protein [Oscillospiraceae bacterium]